MKNMMAIICLVVLMTSCTHKDLCHDHPHTLYLDVNFDWSSAPEASPASMSLYLFPEDGGKTERYEFTDCSGGRIRIMPGTYHAICMNSDTETATCINTGSFHEFCINAKDALSMGSLSMFGIGTKDVPVRSEGERMAASPEPLWSSSMEGIEIIEDGQSITLQPENKICNFTVSIEDVINHEWIKGLSGCISTMAGGFIAGPQTLSEERVTIPFEASIDREKKTIKGAFTSFGHCPVEKRKHYLIIYVILTDGSKWYQTYDVTDQVHDASDPYNIHIVLEEISVPKPEGGNSSGGFRPTVGDWNSIEIEIDM